jgi:tetratricopeptide (TPR) repeat protein
MPAGLFEQAVAQHEAGRLAIAERFYQLVLATQPQHADALHMLGQLLHQTGQTATGLTLIERAIGLQPRIGAYHDSRGRLLLTLGRHEEAVAACSAAAMLAPGDSTVLFDLGHALLAASRYEDAARCLLLCLRLDPNAPGTHLNLGNALRALGRSGEALAAYRAAVRLADGSAEAWLGLGRQLLELGELPEAEAASLRALELRPETAEHWAMVGALLQDIGRSDEALACCAEALRRQPDCGKAHYVRAVIDLAAGRYAEGWPKYEWRWSVTDKRPHVAGAPWTGEPMAGRVLLVHFEQGLGDTIQFCRFVPLAAAQAEVKLFVQEPLRRLLGTLDGAWEAVTLGEGAPPPFHQHCPLLSLPRALGITLENLPSAPYLRAEPALVAAWRERLAALPGLHVGLAWAGSATYANDRQRSLPAEALAVLAGTPGVAFVSLQQGGASWTAPSAEQRAALGLHDWTAELADFADTAALIAALDLVVSVDTATAHLAGALGHPVWLLNRFAADWRWLHDREDSPWYPSMRIFRQQQPGDWPGVLAEVRVALQARAGVPTPEGLVEQALALRKAGQPAAAAALCRQLLEAAPDYARALHLGGVLAHEAGRSAAGLKLIDRAIALEPRNAAWHSNRGLALLAVGRPDEAVAACRTATELAPADPDFLFSLGYALDAASRFEEAEQCLRQCLQVDPNRPGAYVNLGNALNALGRSDEALAAYRTAVRLDPGMVQAHIGLARHLLDRGEVEETASTLLAARRLQPESSELWSDIGMMLADIGRLDAGLECCTEGLARNPGCGKTHYARAAIELVAGRYAEGWVEYEWRWLAMKRRPSFPVAPWAGEPAAGQVLLVHAEQGLGDTIQFCRFVPQAASRAEVKLHVPASLRRLLRTLGDAWEVVTQDDKAPAPPFDLHCPLLSLPQALGITLENLPSAPYLRAEPALVAAWRERLASLPGLRVGLVWAGTPGYSSDRRRSLAGGQIALLAGTPGVSFVSLQQGGAPWTALSAEQRAALGLIDWTVELADFADTAALVAALDLVISVDTAVAHLAGALGQTVWLVNRFDTDWRWLREREDSPWYPSLRIFRQPRPGDWSGVLVRVRAALQARAGEGR